MSRFQAVLFDRAGVLVRAPRRPIRDAWAATRGITPDALDRIVADAIGPGWQGGRGEDEIRRRLMDALSLDDAGLRQLTEVLRADERLDPAMEKYVRELRPAVRTAVVTNSGPGERGYMESRFRMHELVDLMVVSAEEGVAKPDAEIFRRAAVRLAVDPRACIVVDDNPAYLTGAAELGMECIVFTGAEHCIAQLDQALSAT